MKTRTFNYLFRPFLSYIADTGVYNAIKSLRVPDSSVAYKDVNCYLIDPEDDIRDSEMFLYVTVDKSNPKFPAAIEQIQRSLLYIEHYILSGLSDVCVIKFEYPAKYRYVYDKFTNSEYSKMYEPNVSPISHEAYLFREEFRIRVGDNRFEAPYGVLAHSDKYFDIKIKPLLTAPDAELIGIIKAQEYDSKLDLSLETLPQITIN